MKEITEAEYLADLKSGLNELAEAIARTGLTIAAIARACRLHWETVYHAANGIPVRYDSARRILLFTEQKETDSQNNNENSQNGEDGE